MFQGVEHGMHDPIICPINALPDFERLRSNELALHASDVDGEVFDEMGYSVAFFTSQFCFSNRLDLLRLR